MKLVPKVKALLVRTHVQHSPQKPKCNVPSGWAIDLQKLRFFFSEGLFLDERLFYKIVEKGVVT